MAVWKEAYDKKQRPVIEQLKAFMTEDAYALLARFNTELVNRYNFTYVSLTFSEVNGWVYNYGNSGCILVRGLKIEEDAFTVCGVRVTTSAELAAALNEVDKLYEDGYRERLREFKEKRTARRKEKAEEKAEKGIPDEKDYIKACRWPEKVSRNDLRRLYKADAEGLPDTELADKIGSQFYVRCCTAREIWSLLEVGKIKCLYCGEELSGLKDQYAELSCGCGKRYTYHAYRKGFREDNMPRGAASAIFDKFTEDWEKAHDYAEKMRLIDGLVHSFHISIISGGTGRAVGINLIAGTKPQINELILELAR